MWSNASTLSAAEVTAESIAQRQLRERLYANAENILLRYALAQGHEHGAAGRRSAATTRFPPVPPRNCDAQFAATLPRAAPSSTSAEASDVVGAGDLGAGALGDALKASPISEYEVSDYEISVEASDVVGAGDLGAGALGNALKASPISEYEVSDYEISVALDNELAAIDEDASVALVTEQDTPLAAMGLTVAVSASVPSSASALSARDEPTPTPPPPSPLSLAPAISTAGGLQGRTIERLRMEAVAAQGTESRRRSPAALERARRMNSRMLSQRLQRQSAEVHSVPLALPRSPRASIASPHDGLQSRSRSLLPRFEDSTPPPDPQGEVYTERATVSNGEVHFC